MNDYEYDEDEKNRELFRQYIRVEPDWWHQRTRRKVAQLQKRMPAATIIMETCCGFEATFVENFRPWTYHTCNNVCTWAKSAYELDATTEIQRRSTKMNTAQYAVSQHFLHVWKS